MPGTSTSPQPPLYKVSRGRSEVYLKDQAALDAYLIEAGLDGATLRLGSGAVLAGADLARVVEEARVVKATLAGFPTHYPRPIIEQATIAGALLPGVLDADPQGTADAVAARLDLIAAEYERGWQGRPTQDGGLQALADAARRRRGAGARRLRAALGRGAAAGGDDARRCRRSTARRRRWCARTASRRSSRRPSCSTR